MTAKKKRTGGSELYTVDEALTLEQYHRQAEGEPVHFVSYSERTADAD